MLTARREVRLRPSRYGITGTLAGVSREGRVLEIVEGKTGGMLDMDPVDMDTLVHASFADIGQPEPFDDKNGNGAYYAGEPFTDITPNGTPT